MVSGLREEYERETDTELEEFQEETVEDFEKLRRRISQLLENGELTHDHPDYQKYLHVMSSFHGKGQFEFLEHPDAIGVDTQSQIRPPQPSASGEAQEENEGS